MAQQQIVEKEQDKKLELLDKEINSTSQEIYRLRRKLGLF